MDAPRYAVKWVNGYWRVFDNALYIEIATYPLQRYAEEHVQRIAARINEHTRRG